MTNSANFEKMVNRFLAGTTAATLVEDKVSDLHLDEGWNGGFHTEETRKGAEELLKGSSLMLELGDAPELI